MNDAPARRAAPLRMPAFRYLASGYAVNELGNWLGEIALAVLVYDQTGSALATAGLFIAMQFLPAFASQAIVARAETAGTRKVLPLLYLGEAVVFGALALTAGHFSLAIVLALAALDGSLAIAARAFTRVAVGAVLAPAGLLREGNAIVNIGFTVAAAVGPALGGLAVVGLGVQPALWLDAASFVAIAGALAVARALPQVKAEPEHWVARLREGLAYVSGKRVLGGLIIAQSTAFIFFTAVVPIEIVYAKDTLDAGNSGYTALLVSWGAGMVGGSILFTVLGRRGSVQLLLSLGTLAIGTAYLGMAAAGALEVACAFAALGGAGNGVQWVSLVNTIQEMTAERFQARVMGLLESLRSAMLGVGFLFGGVLAAVLDPRATFLAAGLGVVVVLGAAAALLGRADWQPAEVEAPGVAGIRPTD